MRALAIGVIVCGLVGCSTRSLPPVMVLGTKTDAAHPATYNGLALRSGQLVLTESADSTSFVFPLLVKKYYPFTHVAIISVEGGEPWVYDVTGEVKTLPIRSKIMDNVKGKMYRRPLFEYVAPNLYAEIFDPPPGADGEKIAAWARAKFKEGVEFDAYFDAHDHAKLFCSEMAAIAVEESGGPPTPVEASNPNDSIIAGMKWLGVPPGEALPVYRFADPSRYVGALGQFTNRSQAYSYFEGKREIHRRFTADQRMGFVFTLDDYGRIGVRPEISTFVARCAHMYDRDPKPPEPFDPRIENDCRKIADEMFGPFPRSDLGADDTESAESPGNHSMKCLAGLAAGAAALLVAPLASAQDMGGGMGGPTTSGPSWGRPEVVNTPETQGPSPQGKNSVKLFDAYRSQISYHIDVGPIWARRASETTPITRRRNFEHMAPLASEIAFGTYYTTRAFKGPAYLTSQQLTSFRIIDDKSFSWSLWEEKLGGGVSLGPFDFEAKVRAHFVSVDIMHAHPSIQLMSPGVEAGVGFHLGRIRLDIKGHTEYLWRWFGPDYYIRGVTIGLRFDVNRPKNPFPGAPPAE